MTTAALVLTSPEPITPTRKGGTGSVSFNKDIGKWIVFTPDLRRHAPRYNARQADLAIEVRQYSDPLPVKRTLGCFDSKAEATAALDEWRALEAAEILGIALEIDASPIEVRQDEISGMSKIYTLLEDALHVWNEETGEPPPHIDRLLGMVADAVEVLADELDEIGLDGVRQAVEREKAAQSRAKVGA
jgi:hypothetical protein